MITLFEDFKYDDIRKYLRRTKNGKGLVPNVSFVQHLNAGSVNHTGTQYKGHRSHNFIGVKRDPKFWI
jgi:hypothetical protein